MSRSKPFADRSPAEQGVLVVIIAIAVAIVVSTERDIQRRPAEEIRGSKLLWRILCTNVTGVIAYQRWGRR